MELFRKVILIILALGLNHAVCSMGLEIEETRKVCFKF
jgi:hypothetical protein